MQAVQHEMEAAISLYSVSPNEKVTLHYDATTRNHIDGEWVALNQMYRLKPLFFAKETAENIASLIVETYERLASAASTALKTPVSAEALWKNTSHFMTDAVSKNLNVPSFIAKKLKTSHFPSQLLCKAHTVEALDKSNLHVLAHIENALNLREHLVNITPHLRSFYRGKSTVVVCGINALLKDNSANSVSLANEFDSIVEMAGEVKHMSLYHERRFTALGYAAAAILAAWFLLKKLLMDTSANNLLVQACKLYLESDVFLTELKVLAYFTHKVTLPLLNCIAIGNQNDLVQIFRQP